MELSTKYMGKTISNPLIVSSSGLTSNIDNIQKCADNGAGAVVLKSLFEEQIIADKEKLLQQEDMYFWYPEAINYVSDISKEHGISEYLKLIELAKKKVSIPVIASINCVSPYDWIYFAKEIENEGADGLELNIFIPPTNVNLTGYKIEETYIDIVKEVKKEIKIPVSVKIGYYFTNVFRIAYKLSNLDIDNLVLFNRYYRPDIDIHKLRIVTKNVLSDPEEITSSLRWIALLSNTVNCNIIGATGIHDFEGIIKYILAGASAVQVCSVLYKNGIQYLSTLISDIENWMKNNNHKSIQSLKGLITKEKENCAAFERVQFMQKTTGKLT